MGKKQRKTPAVQEKTPQPPVTPSRDLWILLVLLVATFAVYAQVRHFDFINYDDLFPHVDVFVTSGGFGSNLAAFLHGIPVVGAGKREGKNDVNARIGYNNLGIDLRSERPKPAAIRNAVRRLLDDPTYARNVGS